MGKLSVFILLFTSYAAYSTWVYTNGTDRGTVMNAQQQAGKKIWQQYNCTSCHQIFGLGGYLGPELTTVISDKNRGETYARIFLQAGAIRMPNFHFTPEQINDIIAYLKYVDANAFSYKHGNEQPTP